ncbi:MAG: hypothetical protein V5A79_02805 [Candidatus Bipolaricaulota bacterium]
MNSPARNSLLPISASLSILSLLLDYDKERVPNRENSSDAAHMFDEPCEEFEHASRKFLGSESPEVENGYPRKDGTVPARPPIGFY